MSLILEALRKSEAERRRGQTPDVAMELPPTTASRPRTMTAWLLPALILAVLLVLAGWWVRREPANAPATATTEAADESPQLTQQATPPVPQAMPRIEPRPAVAASVQAADMPTITPTTPAPAPAATSPTAAARNVAPATPITPTAIPSQPAPLPPPPPARRMPAPAGDISSDTSMLPPVKLSMLMWDDVPSKRFVILNGQRMAEGDRYGAVTVIAIERGGVVVEGNGTKARVPLP